MPMKPNPARKPQDLKNEEDVGLENSKSVYSLYKNIIDFTLNQSGVLYTADEGNFYTK